MTRLNKIILATAAAAVLAGGVTVRAYAQAGDPDVSAAIASGTVGEQADGYLGFAKAGSGDLKAKVEAINIKRRAAYTDLAAKRGVSVKDAAAAAGCQTLSRLANGRAYLLPGGGWATKRGAIALPGYCG
ncbi:YdbL family protein [Sphingomonas sp. ID0503]|uniref:YdbL family protein n=1 Tax=Sphingomonas sp. ID0503 TaxID=3399691 RepID=UPI003AFB2AB5